MWRNIDFLNRVARPLSAMNVHHLELFYYVAKHAGVSAAARHMPYGIQQPAISAQILQFEDSLNTDNGTTQITADNGTGQLCITPRFNARPR